MKVTVLASGSKGNSALVETIDKIILIDAGLPFVNLEKRLDRKFPKIDVLILTHSHTDHTKGMGSVIKKFKPLILTRSEEVINELGDLNVYSDDELVFEDTSVSLFPLSHDTPCSGVLIKEEDKELVYITDTGYINRRILTKIKDKDIYVMESNHDVEMLRNGRYPFFLQQRILGDKGHLSNEDSCMYLNEVIGPRTKYIVLAHLSEENNTEDMVKEASKSLKKRVKKIYIARQNESI